MVQLYYTAFLMLARILTRWIVVEVYLYLFVVLVLDDRLINPRRACAARVTVVGCLSVCLSLCPLRLERLFVLKTLSHTQRPTKVKIIGGISLKPLRCRDPALPALYGYQPRKTRSPRLACAGYPECRNALRSVRTLIFVCIYVTHAMIVLSGSL